MILIKNKKELELYKDSNYGIILDNIEDAREYPCYITTYVSSWGYEEETAEFMYKSDLKELIKNLQ